MATPRGTDPDRTARQGPGALNALAGRALAWLLILGLAGPALAAGPEHARLQLKWYHQFQFAGYYAAQIKGFYRKAGLDVSIQEASPGHLPLPMVDSGAAEFGVSDMEVFRAYQEGRPLVALGVVFQHSPMAILALKSSRIRRPSDLAGRAVMFQGRQGLDEFQAMLQSEGLPLDSVRIVPHSRRLDDLLQGRVDAVSAYVTNEPYQLQRRGAAFTMLRPEDYGVDFYGDLLFTTRAFAQAHPGATEAFRKASFQGWEYAMEHPDELIDHILSLPGVRERGATREQLAFEAAQMRELVLSGLVDIGHMNPGRFRHIAEWWARLGLLPAPRDVDGFLFQPPASVPPAWAKVLKAGVPALLAAALLILLWVFQLRRTVSARTLALRSEIAQHRRTEQALRESEARYRSILEASPDAVAFTDQGGRIRLASPRALGLWGLREEDGMAGRGILDFVAPEERERVAGHLRQILQGADPGPAAYRGLRVDGTDFRMEVNAAALRGPEGRQASLVLVIRDITERLRAEQERQELKARLNHANRLESLGVLAGGVAHDMNNVLAAILGMASLHLEQAAPGSAQHAGLSTITRAAERGGAMVRGLLNLARQRPEEERDIDLNALLEENLRLLERTTLARVRVVTQLSPGLQPIRGDAAALAHAFMNLCVNAVDAMPEGGTLTVSTRSEPPDRVEVRIADTGCGMPREVLEKAMDPFYTTKGPDKGTGLGLSQVYGTVKAHRGSIALESEPGRGTAVTLGFPACGSAPSAPPAAAAAPSSGQGTGSVLVVDDDDLVRTSIRDMVERLGHAASAVASGEDALACLDDLRPDLVVLDLNMPGMGGAETLAALRRRYPDLPVLLVTGRPDPAALALAGSHPGVALLKKPFDLGALQAALGGLRP